MPGNNAKTIVQVNLSLSVLLVHKLGLRRNPSSRSQRRDPMPESDLLCSVGSGMLGPYDYPTYIDEQFGWKAAG